MPIASVLIGGGLLYLGWRVLNKRYGSPFPAGTSYRITSRVGPRTSPITGKPVVHDGVDLGAPYATPVLAVIGGTVSGVYFSTSGGNVVQVEGEDGIRWLYLHLARQDVARGAVVSKGDQLGLVGSTGNSTGNHLHLEANEPDGSYLDPIALGVPL